MSTTGMTLKQWRRHAFFNALDTYREALRSKDSRAIVMASVAVHAARESRADGRAVNRAFRANGAQ